MKVSRRTLLRAAGWSAVAVSVPVISSCGLLPPLPTFTAPNDEMALAWLQLTPEGKFRFVSPRQEMGQGINIGLKQIIAEELGIRPALIELKMLSTHLIPEVKSTVGSESIVLFAEPTARAAATMRELLITRGAERLGLPPSKIALTDEGLQAGELSLSYRQLAEGKALVLNPKHLSTVPLRSFSGTERRFVGKPMATDQIRNIVKGEPIYAGDIRLEGMVYGGMARPNKLQSELVAVDPARALATQGVIQVVEDKSSVGVVAETPMALQAGLHALDIEWHHPVEVRQDKISALIDIDASDADLEHDVREDTPEKTQLWTSEQRIDIPMAAHMSIETRSAVAYWQKNKVEVWSSTQDPFMVRQAVSKGLGVSNEIVVVHSCRMGGSFGGHGYWADLEAARLSKAVGRPVKVQWTRSENFQSAYHRPPSTHRLRVRVNKAGQITDWWHRFKSGHVVFSSAAMPPWVQKATSFFADFGVARGANPPYRIARAKVEFSDVRIPVDTGPWRGLGAGPNCFAVESAIDMAAREVGADPLDFRLKHIDDERLRHTLKQAAKLAQWRVGDANKGRGLACGIYKDMSYAAMIAEVSLDSAKGSFSIDRLYCAHDCGLVINPDQVRAQVEGNLIWGIGMVKTERLGVSEGRLDADYPGQYHVPTIKDVPPFSIELIESDKAPSGAGETAIVCIAAITNALAGLVKRPVSRLPVDAEYLRS